MKKNTSRKPGFAFGGKKIIFALALLGLMASACAQITLQQNAPTSPKESYDQLPR